MLNQSKTGLQIFENFRINFQLPKWQQRAEKNVEVGGWVGASDAGTLATLSFMNEVNTPSPVNNPSVGITIGSSVVISPARGITSGSDAEDNKPSLFMRIFGRNRLKKEVEQQIAMEAMSPNFEVIESNTEVTITVEEFFSSIKNSTEEIVLVKERIDSYVAVLDHLKKTGQVALYERTKREVECHRAETQLYAIGMTKMITEANVVKFAAESDRKLKLDYISNFVRSIPEKVVNQKMKADENLIFDNYVIMHYDPDDKGTGLTEAEKIKKKDPILFGMIAGRRNLYYVGDWIDEYCDLTFDKLIDKLGKDVVNANDISAKISIIND